MIQDEDAASHNSSSADPPSENEEGFIDVDGEESDVSDAQRLVTAT